jgi:hypothetical protein
VQEGNEGVQGSKVWSKVQRGLQIGEASAANQRKFVLADRTIASDSKTVASRRRSGLTGRKADPPSLLSAGFSKFRPFSTARSGEGRGVLWPSPLCYDMYERRGGVPTTRTRVRERATGDRSRENWVKTRKDRRWARRQDKMMMCGIGLKRR